MCRYAQYSYKPHYACFNCRKTFKRRLLYDIDRKKAKEKETVSAKCPECGELTANMGLDFKSPKKEDIKAWKYLKTLYTVGITYHSCGCSGPGYIPNTTEKLIEYFEEKKQNYIKEMRFWINRTEPVTKREKHSDRDKNWSRIILLPDERNKEKENIKNEEAIKYWTALLTEIESKINTVKASVT